jgi:hypothetical protein
MRPRIRKFLHSLYSSPNSKVLELKYNLSGYSDLDLLKKIRNLTVKTLEQLLQVFYMSVAILSRSFFINERIA